VTTKASEEHRIDQINSLENISFVSWLDGYKNNKSKAIVMCSIDYFTWSSSINELVNRRKGCPSCAGNRRFTPEERVAQISAIEGLEFSRWIGEYKNCKSKAVVTCCVHDFSWAASVNNLLNGQGCPQCGGQRRWTEAERIEQINGINGVKFVSWVNSYSKHDSKAVLSCQGGHEWIARVSSIVNGGSGCPKCAKHGFNRGKYSHLYALRSECGNHIKIGISNNYKSRHSALKRNTPFKWSCVELIGGDGDKIYSLERHFHGSYKSAGLSGFDGATEWLICTDELLDDLRAAGQ